MHVYLREYELSDGFFCRFRQHLRQRPSCGIINGGDNPSIATSRLRKDTNQVNAPSLERLNDWIRHELCIFSLLTSPLTLVGLTIRTRCDKGPQVLFH